MRIAIDLMGGDSSPLVLFEGVLQAAAVLPDLEQLVILATASYIPKIQQLLSQQPKLSVAISLLEVAEFIKMAEAPALAVRRKKEASLLIGLQYLRDKKVDAFITMGNTGALVLGARHYLETLPGISRPGLLALIPSEKKPVAVIDVGGNVSCSAKDLVQFSRLGAAFYRCLFDVASPKVGLLNVGTEAKKGSQTMQNAYNELRGIAKTAPGAFKFMGNVEGNSVFKGNVNVLVTDGLTGNVFLKTAEGTSAFLLKKIDRILQKNPLLLDRSLHSIIAKLDPQESPGATLCGVDGIVIKCHGSATAKALFQGIRGAYNLVKNNYIKKISDLCS